MDTDHAANADIDPAGTPGPPGHGGPVRTIATVIAAILIVGGLVMGLLSVVGGGPLEGEAEHDFGLITIADGEGFKEHTFRLVNTTSGVIPVEGARASCGCTTTDISTDFIEPGEALEVTARLTLKKSGVKQSTVTLLLGDAGRQVLKIRGVGRMEQFLRANADEVIVFPGSSGSITLVADRYGTDEAPPAPRITVPEGVEVTIEPWKQFGERDEDAGKPAEWKCGVTVEPTGGAVEDGWTMVASLTLPAEGTQSIELPMVERVGRRSLDPGEGKAVTPTLPR